MENKSNVSKIVCDCHMTIFISFLWANKRTSVFVFHDGKLTSYFVANAYSL